MVTFAAVGMPETESITASLDESSLRGGGWRGSLRRLPRSELGMAAKQHEMIRQRFDSYRGEHWRTWRNASSEFEG